MRLCQFCQHWRIPNRFLKKAWNVERGSHCMWTYRLRPNVFLNLSVDDGNPTSDQRLSPLEINVMICQNRPPLIAHLTQYPTKEAPVKQLSRQLILVTGERKLGKFWCFLSPDLHSRCIVFLLAFIWNNQLLCPMESHFIKLDATLSIKSTRQPENWICDGFWAT